MDVRTRLLGAIALSFLISACSQDPLDALFDSSSGAKQGTDTCTGAAKENSYIVMWKDGHITVEHDEDLTHFKENFLRPRIDDIKKVEFDRVIELSRESQESTPVSAQAVSGNDWGQSMIEAQSAWSAGYQGQGAVVGVVDSTVDYTHPELMNNVYKNTADIPGNAIDDDSNGYVDDTYGYSFTGEANPQPADHGTHVSGIIAADGVNGSVTGVAPRAKIIPASFIGADGRGSLGNAIMAMNYVVSRGATIINASWGGAPCVDSMATTFNQLSAKGVLIVVAAGNSGVDISAKPEYPASFNVPSQITVAAASSSDFMTSWSNSSYSLVHLAAPGDNILSTVTSGFYSYMSGTSMAAPFVTGAAAVLKGAFPTASAAQIKSALLNSVDITTNHEYRVQTHGRLNLRKALDRLRSTMTAVP